MDLKKLLERFENCPCGERHTVDIEDIIIEHGVKDSVGSIIADHTDEKKLLLVADNNTLSASDGVVESLVREGFDIKEQIYDDLRVADMPNVRLIEKLCADREIVLSVGSGSLNDICRLAAARQNKKFVLFATAPSMDGLASDTAPITDNNFKMSYQARQPFLIIADTQILAKAPEILKGSGFGDMMGKYIGLADWNLSHVLTGEKLCTAIEGLTWEATERIKSLADRITADDEESAKAVTEALTLTGIAMKFAHSSRPASGAEHILSHFWEIKKLEEGLVSDFHGRKVAVATLVMCRLYHKLASVENIKVKKEIIDWEAVKRAYGPALYKDVEKLNFPVRCTDAITPESIEKNWETLRNFVFKYVPRPDEMEKLLIKGGAPTTLEEIGVKPELGRSGLIYHPFMRKRVNYTTIIPMLDIDDPLTDDLLGI